MLICRKQKLYKEKNNYLFMEYHKENYYIVVKKFNPEAKTFEVVSFKNFHGYEQADRVYNQQIRG